MAGPFINWVLLRLIEPAVTSRRLAHLQKYQQSFNAINIPKPKGISKHVITVMLSSKMFYQLNCLENADFDNIAWFLVTSLDSFLNWKEVLECRQKENTAASGDIYQRRSVASAKNSRNVFPCGLLMTNITRILEIFILTSLPLCYFSG